MTFRSNAHTHTQYCDGKNTPEEMIAAAKTLGFVSLGFSGHGSQGFDPDYSMSRDKQQAYLLELRALQARMQQEGTFPRLWVGIEQDALSPQEQKAENRRACDYVLGATHYLSTDFRGRCVAVDGDITLLRDYVQEAWQGDMLAMASFYYDRNTSMLLEDRPDIIGHFDLVRKYAGKGNDALFDDGAPAYRRMAREALEASFPSGGVLEVNTGGMARGFQSWAYPSKELLGQWRELGGEITITSDCHDVALLDYGFAEALKCVKELGYKTVKRLGAGQDLWETVEL